MGATEQARIEASLGGVDQVEAGARKMGDGLEKAATRAQSKMGGALKGIASGLGQVISAGLTASGVLGALNVAKAVDDVKHLDEQTARLGQTAGVSGEKLRSGFDALEKRTLNSSMAMADFAAGLGRATYNSKGALNNVSGLADVALALGQSLDDQQGFGAAALGGLGAEDAAAELERIRAQAAALGETGTDTAARLKDLFSGLGGSLQQVATGTDEARGRLEALIIASSKGLKPEQAKSVSAGLLGFLKGKASDIQRVTGKDILDEYGQIKDPTQALAIYKKMADDKFGKKDSVAKQRAIIAEAGQDVGRAIIRTDPALVGRLAGETGDGTTAKEAEAARQADAAKRKQIELAKDQARRGIGQKFVAAQDGLVNAVGVPAATVIEAGGGALALKGAVGAGKLAVGALGAGGAALAGGVGGAILAQGALVSSLGQDRKEMGNDWRSRHKETIAAEAAQQAVGRGDLTQSYLVAKREDALPELLSQLLQRQDRMNETLKEQTAAFAAELRKAPLIVRQAAAPNDGKPQ